MSIASNPDDLVRRAEAALVAARAAEVLLRAHPVLTPYERIHALGFDGHDEGPSLEVQLGDDREDAVAQWAAVYGIAVTRSTVLGSTTHAAAKRLDGIKIQVTAWTRAERPECAPGRSHRDDGTGLCEFCGTDLTADET